MWRTLRISRQTDTEFVSSVTELLQSTTRTLIFATGGICLLWYVVANVTIWWREIPRISAILMVLSISTAIALRLLSRQLKIAQTIWLMGLTLSLIHI